MILKQLKIRVHPDLHRRFLILCLQNRLSHSKQMNELIRNFVEIHEKNYEIMNKLERK